MNPAHLKAPHNLRTVWDLPCRSLTTLSPGKYPDDTFVIDFTYHKSFIISPRNGSVGNGVSLDLFRHPVDRA